MADNLNIRFVPDLDRFIGTYAQGPKIVTEELKASADRSGLRIERKAKANVRVWRRELQRSITNKTTSRPLFASNQIGTNKVYGAAEEFGRPAGAKMPPPGVLLPWMAAHGIPATEESIKGTKRVRDEKGNVIGSIIKGSRDFIGPRRYLPIEFLIARAIKRKAPDPHPYLGKAAKEEEAAVRQDFHGIPMRVIARLKAGG